MKPRHVLLTKLPLLKEGFVVTVEQRDRLQEALIEALCVDVPVLRHLRASTLEVGHEVVGNELYLLVELVEANWSSADLFSNDAQATAKSLFAKDVQDAQMQMALAEWRVREAIAEGRSPSDGSADSPSQSSTRAIRQRVRSLAQEGRIWIPASPIAKQVDVPELPSFLARGPKLYIEAQVEVLTKRFAKLAGVLLISAREETTAVPGAGRCTRLHRDLQVGHKEWGQLLQLAMDRGDRIKLPVVAALDWSNGETVHFQLEGLPPGRL